MAETRKDRSSPASGPAQPANGEAGTPRTLFSLSEEETRELGQAMSRSFKAARIRRNVDVARRSLAFMAAFNAALISWRSMAHPLAVGKAGHYRSLAKMATAREFLNL